MQFVFGVSLIKKNFLWLSFAIFSLTIERCERSQTMFVGGTTVEAFIKKGNSGKCSKIESSVWSVV